MDLEAWLEEQNERLTAEVKLALFKAAEKGNVAAAALWLKACANPPKTLDDVTNEELLQLLTEQEMEVPADFRAAVKSSTTDSRTTSSTTEAWEHPRG